MVQAFEASDGDGKPEIESNNYSDHSLIAEVIDFVKENRTLSTIAGIGVAAGAVYLARAPIGRFLGGLGGSLFAADEAAVLAAKMGKSPLGRELVVAGEEAAAGLKQSTASAVAAGEEVVIVSGEKVSHAAAGSKRPLLDALDDAVKSGKVNSPEPWVYHPENRVILKDLPKGGSAEIKSAEGGLGAATTAHSTHSPEAADIVRIGFPGLTKSPVIDVNKHRFLRGK